MQVDNQPDISNLDLNGAPRQAQAQARAAPAELRFDEDRLKIYYERVFPYKLMFKWISYGKIEKRDHQSLASLEDGTHSKYFHEREFSFTLANDVYCRYICFKNAEEFKQVLVERVPYKIDIGAVYNIPPSRHNSSDKKAFIPMQKEMVFDIDMNDYDDVRSCCQGANVCERCFAYLKIAMKVISDILVDDFDFTNLLWVFSGRRGIHAWVCDEGARAMNNEMRAAVVNYCNVGIGNENHRLQLDWPLHPRLRKTYEYLEQRFNEVILGDHDLLSTETHRERMLGFMPNEELKKKVRTEWRNKAGQDSTALWAIFMRHYREGKQTNKIREHDLSIQSLVFTYLYPRIDANVSTGINHLLKSPWCIHPKTGKICVPIDPKNPDAFNCEQVPTLTQVINEIGSAARKTQEEGESVTPPCLEPFMATFKQFLRAASDQRIEEIRQRRQAQQAQMSTDF